MATPPSPPGGPDNGNADNHGQGPPETEYLLSDNRENVSSCYVEAGA